MKQHLKNNIAFTLITHEYDKWHAGLTCVVSHINLTKHLNNFHYYIFTDSKKFVKKNLDTKSLTIIETNIFKKNSINNYIRKLIIFLFHKDYLFFYILKKFNIKILSHRDLFKNRHIKSVAWIPDAQHLVLKNTFNKKEYDFRVKFTEKQMSNSDMIFVESHSVKKYFKKYYKNINFFPLRRAVRWFKLNKSLKNTFIKKPFFYFPAQLWLHKNHFFIVSLAEKLKKRQINCKFIFSGRNEDHRNPNHYKNLINLINKKKLNDYFEFLGHVDSSLVKLLIKKCEALISPSKHEGWATISEESRFFGKYVFLSKIACHIEQNPPGAIYFNLKNIKELEKKFVKFIKKPPTKLKKKKLIMNCKVSYKKLKNETISETNKAYCELLNKF